MTFRVLKSWEENLLARHELARTGIGYWPKHQWAGLSGLARGVIKLPIGDLRKSWDVLLTIRQIENALPRDAVIVDLGAYCSEVLCALAATGYTHLTGIDLNPLIRRMPYGNRVRWTRGDMTRTGLPAESVDAVIAISSIEHGEASPVVAEAARLLRPGGLFIGSTDYWPEKVNTHGLTLFNMPWNIFSAPEIVAFFKQAEVTGLHATGPVETAAQERCIYHEERLYTFGWFCLEKNNTPQSG
jgi:SAM-dependent methyltransferase